MPLTSSINTALYHSIHEHLMNDYCPSQYLNSVISNPVFETYPYQMLLNLKKTEQSPIYHPEGNVWNHTMLVVDQAARCKDKSNSPAVFMWAALLHDIGKPSTTKIRKGKIISYDHDLVGAALSKEFLSTFTLDQQFIIPVSLLIQYHMQILYIMKDLPFAALKEMKEQVDMNDLALLDLCDRVGRAGSDFEAERKNIENFILKCSLH